LRIRDDHTGSEIFNAGPCHISDASSPMCVGYDTVSFALTSDAIIGTYTSVVYKEQASGKVVTDFDTSDAPGAGKKLTLKWVRPGLLSSSTGGNYCSDDADEDAVKQCGG
jgi:hypothetical protein